MSPAVLELVTTAHNHARRPAPARLGLGDPGLPLPRRLGRRDDGPLGLLPLLAGTAARTPRSASPRAASSCSGLVTALARACWRSSSTSSTSSTSGGSTPTFEPASPMSWGAWILLLVYPVLAAAVLLRAAGAAASRVVPALGALSRRLAGDAPRARCAGSASMNMIGVGARHLHRHPALGPRRAAALEQRAPRPALPRLRALVEPPPSPTGVARRRTSASCWPGSTTCFLDRSSSVLIALLPDRPRLLDRGARRGRAARPRRALHRRLLGRRRRARHRPAARRSSRSPSPTASSTRRSRRCW